LQNEGNRIGVGAIEEKKEMIVEGCRWDMKVINMKQSKTSAHGLTYLDSS
jgi:hypothetical protein